jgi:hypothetical protein
VRWVLDEEAWVDAPPSRAREGRSWSYGALKTGWWVFGIPGIWIMRHLVKWDRRGVLFSCVTVTLMLLWAMDIVWKADRSFWNAYNPVIKNFLYNVCFIPRPNDPTSWLGLAANSICTSVLHLIEIPNRSRSLGAM